MGFLKPKVTLSITVAATKEEGERHQAAIKKLLENCSLEEMELLAEAAGRPMIKAAAVTQLKQIL